MERIGRREIEYVLEVLGHGFRASRHHRFNVRLEEAFAAMLGGGHAISMVNGTATLHAALASLGVGPGDEVITPPLTMGATSLCVLHAGATPVFADVSAGDWMLDPDSVERVATPRARAVVGVGLYGAAPDYPALLEVCRRRGLYLVEDDAECLGACHAGRPAGCFGDFASFSFQASKHLTCGEGGMLFTRDPELAGRAQTFSRLGYPAAEAKRGHISKDSLQLPDFARHIALGFNYRMPELCAATALAQVERADELVRARREAAAAYDLVAEAFPWLQRQRTPANSTHTYWCYPAAMPAEWGDSERQAFRDAWKNAGGEPYYAAWRLTYNEPLFKAAPPPIARLAPETQSARCPNAESLQPRIMQFKTNFWDADEGRRQADALARALGAMERAGG